LTSTATPDALPRRLLHTSRQIVRWGDMDFYGHVNNTVYFRYFEQARVEWLEQAGFAVSEADNRAGDHQCQLHLPDSGELSRYCAGAHVRGRTRPQQCDDLVRALRRG
jgi:hypothetical protein